MQRTSDIHGQLRGGIGVNTPEKFPCILHVGDYLQRGYSVYFRVPVMCFDYKMPCVMSLDMIFFLHATARGLGEEFENHVIQAGAKPELLKTSTRRI